MAKPPLGTAAPRYPSLTASEVRRCAHVAQSLGLESSLGASRTAAALRGLLLESKRAKQMGAFRAEAAKRDANAAKEANQAAATATTAATAAGTPGAVVGVRPPAPPKELGSGSGLAAFTTTVAAAPLDNADRAAAAARAEGWHGWQRPAPHADEDGVLLEDIVERCARKSPSRLIPFLNASAHPAELCSCARM
jgi:hypothetical protein